MNKVDFTRILNCCDSPIWQPRIVALLLEHAHSDSRKSNTVRKICIFRNCSEFYFGEN